MLRPPNPIEINLRLRDAAGAFKNILTGRIVRDFSR